MPYRLDSFVRLVPLFILSVVLTEQAIFDPETGQRIDLEFELEAYNPDTGEMYYTAEEIMQFANEDVRKYYSPSRKFWLGVRGGYATLISPAVVIIPVVATYGGDDPPAFAILAAMSMYYIAPKILAYPNIKKIPKGVAYYSKKTSPSHRELYQTQMKIEERKIKRKTIRSGVLGWLSVTFVSVVSNLGDSSDEPDEGYEY